MPLLLVPFFLWVVLEFATLIAIGSAIGIGWTALAYLVCAIGGLWILRRQGLSALQALRRGPDGMAAGPDGGQGGLTPLAMAAFDGALLTLAGLLLLLPGFLSAVPGLLLLVPQLRRSIAGRLFARRPVAQRPGVIDVEYEEVRRDDPANSTPGPSAGPTANPTLGPSRWGRPPDAPR